MDANISIARIVAIIPNPNKSLSGFRIRYKYAQAPFSVETKIPLVNWRLTLSQSSDRQAIGNVIILRWRDFPTVVAAREREPQILKFDPTIQLLTIKDECHVVQLLCRNSLHVYTTLHLKDI